MSDDNLLKHFMAEMKQNDASRRFATAIERVVAMSYLRDCKRVSASYQVASFQISDAFARTLIRLNLMKF